MDEILTVSEELFCQNIIKGMTQHDAYKEAFDSDHLKDNTINTNASILRKKPKIKSRIDEIRKELLEKTQISVEAIIEELAHIAFDDISNYVSFGARVKKVNQNEDGTVEPVLENYVELKESSEIDTRSIQEIKLAGNGGISFKMYGKDTALVNLGKALGLFVDKWEGYIEGKLSDEESPAHKFSDEAIRNAYDALYKQAKNKKKEKK